LIVLYEEPLKSTNISISPQKTFYTKKMLTVKPQPLSLKMYYLIKYGQPLGLKFELKI